MHPQDATEAFFGVHQGGIETNLHSHGVFASFDLVDGFNRDAAIRLMRVVTDIATDLTRGVAPMSDSDPELAVGPSRLTVAFGLGRQFFIQTGLVNKLPDGFVEIPSYEIDELSQNWSGGDFLIQICSDDSLVASHALRHLSRSIRSFVSPRWVQRGFTQTQGSVRAGRTPRNLMGQIDGTVNPRKPDEFAEQVWAPSTAGWFADGTMLVVRRIEMNLDSWDSLDRPAKELTIGRTLSNGAPLTGTDEFDVPDLEQVGANGLLVIPPFAHVRRARTGNPLHRFLRRPFQFDEGTNAKGVNEAGIIFAAYTANVADRFVPVQNSLATQDLLNKWTTPVGSAVFVLPPGCEDGGYIGETLLA